MKLKNVIHKTILILILAFFSTACPLETACHANSETEFMPEIALLLTTINYYAEGILDSAFGNGGIVTYDTGSVNDQGNDLVIQPDGKILITGNTGNFPEDMAIWRYNSDGSPDATFGTDGVVGYDSGGATERGQDIAVQPDGKIVVTGTATLTGTNMGIWRYNSNGTPDGTFGSGGLVISDPATGAENGLGLAIQTDGKIVVTGYIVNTDADMGIWRYNSNGTLDGTFGSGGIATYDGGGTADWGQAIALQADGKIVVTGYKVNTSNDMVIWRYNSNGTLDGTFGSGGIVTYDSGNNDVGLALALQSDGKIVVTGYKVNTDTNMGIWRYNSNGTLDVTFGIGGIVTYDSGNNDQGVDLVIQPDGKVVVAGYIFNTNEDMAIWRYNSNGTLDTSFGGGRGFVMHNNAAGGNGFDTGFGVALSLQRRLYKIVVVGRSDNASANFDMAVWQYK